MLNLMQKKAILDALKDFGIQDWKTVEDEAKAAGQSDVVEYLRALGVAVPGVTDVAGEEPAEKPAKKIVKIETPAPVAVVDNSAKVAEIMTSIETAEGALKLSKSLDLNTADVEAKIAALRAELAKLTGKPAKKAERPQLPPFTNGMVFGQDAGEGVVSARCAEDLWAAIGGMRFGKGKNANVASANRAGIDYIFYWARFPDQTDWSEFILDGLFEPDADGNRGPCQPFMVRSLAPDKEKGLPGRVFVHKQVGREFPEEGNALVIRWTYNQEPARRWVVTAKEKPYKVSPRKNGPDSESEVELPSHMPGDSSQVHLPKAPRRTEK